MPITVLTLSVKDKSGDTHPNAVVIPGTVVMDNIDKTGGVSWVYYHDGPSYLAGLSPLNIDHHTDIPTPLYQAVLAFDTGKTVYGPSTEAALMFLAMSVKDTPGVSSDGTPLLDPATGQPVLVSPFAGAQITALQVPVTLPGG